VSAAYFLYVLYYSPRDITIGPPTSWAESCEEPDTSGDEQLEHGPRNRLELAGTDSADRCPSVSGWFVAADRDLVSFDGLEGGDAAADGDGFGVVLDREGRDRRVAAEFDVGDVTADDT